MCDESTYKMDIKIRALAFELYKLKENIGLAKPKDMIDLKFKGIELETETFDVLIRKGRRILLQETITYLHLVFEDWLERYRRILNLMKHHRKKSLNHQYTLNKEAQLDSSHGIQ
jgi:hypothetical protein